MNPVTMAGAFIITFSLLSYGIGSITFQRFKQVSPAVLIFLSLGICLDLIAVVLMFIGSDNSAFRFHGLLGYSALLVMFIDVIWVWRVKIKKGWNTVASKKLLNYSKLAYTWWVIAYFTGSLIIIF